MWQTRPYNGGWSIFMAQCTGRKLDDPQNLASQIKITVWGPGEEYACPNRGIAFPLTCNVMCVKNKFAVTGPRQLVKP